MRKLLIDHFKQHVPSVNGRVYQPHMAGSKTKTPYLVIKSAGEVAGNIRDASNRFVEIWPYVKDDNFIDVDTITGEIFEAVKAMNNSADGIMLRFTSMGQDYYDPEYKQLTNGPISFDSDQLRI